MAIPPLDRLLAEAQAAYGRDRQHVPTFALEEAGEACALLVDWRNQRLKLMDVSSAAVDTAALEELVGAVMRGPHAFGKVLAYVHDADEEPWEAAGFRPEAELPGFFADGAAARIRARFIDPQRGTAVDEEALDRIAATARSREPRPAPLPAGHRARSGTADDAPALSAMLQDIFPAYPTPLAVDYLAARITAGLNHFEIVEDAAGAMVAVISAEIDADRRNAEISDCATLPSSRGQGLMRHLIGRVVEQVHAQRGIGAFYTLARACEPGVNISFARCGFYYTGRLVNNCRMPHGWESMNAWVKAGDAL